MRPTATLALFGAGVVAVFAAALGVGSAVGPVVDDDPVTTAAGTAGKAGADGMSGMAGPSVDAEGGNGHAEEPAASELPGLAVSDDGWTLRLADDRATAGPAVPLRFAIEAPDGGPETAYVETHTKDLHLIVVRRDLATFEHVHPTLGRDGTWTAPLDLTAPGTYRVLADFQPQRSDRKLTLGADLAVAGDFAPLPLPPPDRTADAGHGYTVTLAGAPHAGREAELTLAVSRKGRPVDDLQPYLGAYGHLVALRHGDLAYLHTHPQGPEDPTGPGGPDIRFMTTFPTAGSYRLFLDFRAGGEVRTAAFTVEVQP